ncbi:glycosyltransferase [Robertmurraya massiliosenegalensis]|uniref:glycosyltransferase family 2 protein n=1 Tax=Robertmurraya TaxID=2837507 RepID=UPI0039A44B05
MISIVLPVYNSDKYIRHSIESVINQSYIDWELIVIDDGSIDQTGSIIQEYNSDRIHYHYQSNQGPSAARNKGISLAKGEYIAFIDADDIYRPNKLYEQVRFLENHPEIQIVYCDAQVVNKDLKPINVLRTEGLYDNKEDFFAQLLFRQILPLPPAIMLKRECLQEIKYNEKLVHAEDYDLTIQLARKFRFGYLPESLYIYRRHEDNLTNGHEKQVQAEMKIVKSIGIANIKEIVNKSTFSFEDKSLLLAKIFMKIECYDESIETLSELITQKNKNPLVYFYSGNCMYAMNQLEKAEQLYRMALTYDENMAETYNNLGCILAINGFLVEAAELFERALCLRSNYMDASFNKVQLNSAFQKCKLTWRELRKTLTNYT